MIRATVLGLLLLGAPGTVLAHGGGLNAEGCHTNRKTGSYHCHGGGKAASRAPVTLISGEGMSFLERPENGASFANCAAARRAGAAPVRRGEPGYGAHLDRDNDGVGCE